MQNLRSPFKEPSLAWYEACETALRLLRTKVSALAPNTSLCFHASVEAALVEWALLLLDRNREMGSGRTGAVIEAGDDPCLRFPGQIVSSQSLAVADFAAGTVVAANALFCAFCDDDRFEAMERDSSNRDKILSETSWSRVPLLRVRQLPPTGIDALKPRPYEIKIVRLSDGSAVSILGDRLRLVPRFSQHTFQTEAIALSATAFRAFVEECAAANNCELEIAAFVKALPVGWRILNPGVGERRAANRMTLVTEAYDSSWIADRLIEKYPRLQRGIDVIPLSGCEIGDERLQEWLRARAQAQLATPLEIRGATQIKVSALLAVLPGADAGAKADGLAAVLESMRSL